MTQIAIKKVNGAEQGAVPIFEKLAKKVEAIRQRAFQLFERRGQDTGHDMDDWLAAERELLTCPAAELVEADGVYQMDMKLPGFAAKEVEVTATPHELIVHAESGSEVSKREGRVLWSEFGANDVYRCIELPVEINVDKVAARLEKGVLHVTAPKAH